MSRSSPGPCLTDRTQAGAGRQHHRQTRPCCHRAGVEIAICTDHPETPIQYLPSVRRHGRAGGLTRRRPLAAITLSAARAVRASQDGWAPSPPARTPTWW
ncbi:MAG: hypothetical protein ACLRWQ_24310 [Flavonifractor plautii]